MSQRVSKSYLMRAHAVIHFQLKFSQSSKTIILVLIVELQTKLMEIPCKELVKNIS